MATKIGKSLANEASAVSAERAGFKSLLVTNPNYFGTATNSGFPVVPEIAGNTTYEQIDCVSYNPDLNLLEATISIKLQNGYGGGLCQAGSLEFVQFFLDYGSGWVNAGLSTVEVHDLPEELDCFDTPVFPLSYTATVQVQPEREPCWSPVLPVARAILSWSVIPTGHDFIPVWGEVSQCNVQIRPRPPFVLDALADISAELKKPVKLPASLASAGSIPLPGPAPQPLGLAALADLYAPQKQAPAARAAGATLVPAHRFGFTELAHAAASATLDSEFIGQNIAA